MIRVKNGQVSADFNTFRSLDYVEVCEHLGLRPSRPWDNAQGENRKPRRRRSKRRRQTAHRE